MNALILAAMFCGTADKPKTVAPVAKAASACKCGPSCGCGVSAKASAAFTGHRPRLLGRLFHRR